MSKVNLVAQQRQKIETQINKSRNESGDITIDTTEIQIIMRLLQIICQ